MPLIDTDHIEDESDNDDVGEIPAKPAPKVEEKVNGRGKRKAAVGEATNGLKEEKEECEDDEEEEEEVYEVEGIEDHKVARGSIKLFVKWKGYEAEEDKTWEPEETLTESASEILAEYYRSIGGRPAGESKASKKKVAAKAVKSEDVRVSKRQKREEEDTDTSWVPKGKNWEKDVEAVTNLEQQNNRLMVFVKFTNARTAKITSDMAYERFPQTMLMFYESKLAFKVDDDE